MSKEDNDARKRAHDDLTDIEALQRSEPFNRYFLRRLKEELKKREEKVLTDKTLTKDQLLEERIAYMAQREIATMLSQEEAACRNVIGPGGDED
jgi:hypothetical protein